MTRPRLHTSPEDAPLTAADYLARLRLELAVFQRWNAEPYVTACQRMIADWEAMTAAEAEQEYTLTDAAALCGYSADHLGKLVRAGTLTNYGRTGSPRVRRGDLPKRPTRMRGDLPSGAAERTVGASKRDLARSITGAR